MSFIKTGVLKNFAKFTGKKLWRRSFPVNFATFLRTPYLQNTSERLLLDKDLQYKTIIEV